MKKLALVLGLALLGACAASPEPYSVRATGEIATGTTTHHHFDKQTSVFRSGISAVDSTNIGAVITAAAAASPSQLFGIKARDNLTVSARFTNAAQSCAVRYVAMWTDGNGVRYVLGITNSVTLTAGSFRDPAGLYMAPTWVFDSFGASDGLIVVETAPGAGSVNFWCGSN